MKQIFIISMILGVALFKFSAADAHPMPNSVVELVVNDEQLLFDLKLPVQEFELAFGQKLMDLDADQIMSRYGTEIGKYIQAHFQVKSKEGVEQYYALEKVAVDTTSDQIRGKYLEITALINCPVTTGFNPRDFILDYDVIIHQVANHFAIVKIKQDFESGLTQEDQSTKLGVIALDIPSDSIKPMHVQLQEGTRWKGFVSMFLLGMQHIRVGLDHILFLLTLLLVAPLAFSRGRWSQFKGWKYTVQRFFKISFAFTIGHSVALFLGAFNLLHFKGQYIEVLIALSILITAVNAAYPIFAAKEAGIAALFGVVHGFAFAEAITSLQLSVSEKLLSILGFNMGIETMQLLIMMLFFPVILLSRFRFYKAFRIAIACGTGLLAIACAVERTFNLSILL